MTDDTKVRSVKDTIGYLVEESRTATANYELYQYGPVPTVSVDGVADLISGPAVAQLKLYRIENIDFDQEFEGLSRERRATVVNIHIPTVQLIELAHNLLEHFRNNKDDLVEGMKERIDRVSALLERE